jgi:hypothetical protein
MTLYELAASATNPNCEFLVLRQTRDVIRNGAFRIWDRGPGAGCPVKDRFYHRFGLRAFLDEPTREIACYPTSH